MYDELVKRLRNLAGMIPHKHTLPSGADTVICSLEAFMQIKELAGEAADAIEELSMKLHGDEAAIAGMKREIERMVRAGKPRWIPVTERLPPYGDRILVTDKTGVWEGYLSYSRGFMRNTEMTIKDIYDVEVTHWMPLPEPPKEEV